MIEELKLLLDAVADIPSLAIFLAIAFLLYKLIIAGGIVLALSKGWQALMDTIKKHSDNTFNAKTTEIAAKNAPKEFKIAGITITGCETLLRNQITRIAGKNLGIKSRYIHEQSVDWLREAIDAKEREDQNK